MTLNTIFKVIRLSGTSPKPYFLIYFIYSELIGHYARLLKEKGIVRAINTEEYDYNAVYVCILGANTFSSGKMEQKYTQEECLGKAVWYYSNACEALDRIMTRTPETMDPLKPLYSVLQTECQKLEETGHL